MMKIFKPKTLVTVNIIYWRPEYHHILQEFIWQFEDVVPEIPRVHKYLNFWRTDINAIIQEVLVAHGRSGFRNIKDFQEL